MTDEPDDQELENQRRSSAQSAAADLARMGIDPRTLGLEPPDASAARTPGTVRPAPPPQVPAVPTVTPHDEPAAHASVTPLRPEYAVVSPIRPADATGPAPAAAPGPLHPGGPVEALLARTMRDLPAPSRSAGIVRSITLGLVTPDAAESTTQDREVVSALRTRQTERRVVSFFAGKGGVGVTTVAAGVGAALAALREDLTALVDPQSGTVSLGAALGASSPQTVRGYLRRSDDASAPSTAAGLRVVDGVGWEQRLTRAEVTSTIDRLGADHTFVLLDVGNDPGEAAHAALARSDQTVIVTAAGGVGLAAAQLATARLAHTDPFAVERAVYVIVCQHDAAYRRVHREVTAQLPAPPGRVVVVPPDEVLAAGQPFDPSLVRGATREAMVRVAAALALSGARR